MSKPFEHLDDEDREAAFSILRVEIARRRRRVARIDALRAAAAEARYEKRCPGCDTTRPVAEFGRNAARPDGLQSLCRACR